MKSPARKYMFYNVRSKLNNLLCKSLQCDGSISRIGKTGNRRIGRLNF